MSIIQTDQRDEAARLLAAAPSPVVVVPIYNAYADVVRCIESVLTHTPVTHSILVVDDCGVDRRAIGILADISERPEHQVVVYTRAENGGFVRSCNEAFDITAGRDVVLLNSDVVVGPEWLPRLTAAACSSNLIATATTLTNFGTIVSVPTRNESDTRLPGNLHPDVAAKLVADASLQLRPTIPTAVGHCFYVKRAALDAVGDFDEGFARGYGEEVDFSQRAIEFGFRHVCADDVFTYHRGNASFGKDAKPEQIGNEMLVNARYAWYRHAVKRASTDERSPLAQALACARAALIGHRFGVDATCLGGSWMGTQAVTFETVLELARLSPDSPLRVFVRPNAQRAVLAAFAERTNIVVEQVHDLRSHEGTKVDLVYRPFQVSWLDELKFLRRHGDRVIVNQLDTIAWSNPSYFPTDDDWLHYRETTRHVLSVVDGVAFISDFARQEAAAEALLPSSTPTGVVYCGTTSSFDAVHSEPHVPFGFVDDDRPLLLTIGTSYHHKNRPFAFRLFERLVQRGFDGRLVLAGPNPPIGHSLGREAEVLLRNPDLRADIAYLGDLTEGEKAWLYGRARLVIYPTCSEGFGLVPFEAARFGTPTLASRQGSLDEVLPVGIRTIESFDLDRSVEDAWTLLTDEAERTAMSAALTAADERFTWTRTSEALLELFDEVLCRPPVRVAAIWGEHLPPWQLDPDLRGGDRRVSGAVESGIRRLQSMEGLRKIAVPPGSQRQRAVRTASNWARRQSSKADDRRV